MHDTRDELSTINGVDQRVHSLGRSEALGMQQLLRKHRGSELDGDRDREHKRNSNKRAHGLLL